MINNIIDQRRAASHKEPQKVRNTMTKEYYITLRVLPIDCPKESLDYLTRISNPMTNVTEKEAKEICDRNGVKLSTISDHYTLVAKEIKGKEVHLVYLIHIDLDDLY